MKKIRKLPTLLAFVSSCLGLLLLLLAMPALAQEPAGKAKPAAVPAGTSPAPGSAEASVQTRSEAYEHYTLGHYYETAYENEGDPEDANRAIDEYKKAEALDPDSSVIPEQLAEIYAKSQRVDEAVKEAKSLLARDPNDAGAHRLLARLYIRQLSDPENTGNQKETLQLATEQFEEVLRIKPDDTQAALWLARLYRFDNKHDAAEGILKGVLKRDPSNEEALQQLAQIYLDEGRTPEAVQLLEQATGRSSSTDLLGMLGQAYSRMHDNAKAEAAYQKGVDEDPEDPNLRRGLAQSYLSDGKLPEALAQYERLTELEPDSAENYLRVAQICRRLDRLDEAEKFLMEAKERAPDSLEILYNEALLYESQGRFDDAIHILNDAIARLRAHQSDSNSDALSILYELLGGVYRDKNDTANAVTAYEQMGELTGGDQKRSHMLVIEAYRSGKEIDQALAEIRKYMAADSSDTDYQFTYAMLLGESGKTSDAVQYLRGMIKAHPSDAEVYLNLAQVQQRGHLFADSEKSAQQAAQLATSKSDKTSAWFLLGAAYEREKKYDLAEEQFKKVLALDPQNAEALNYYGYMLAERGLRLDEAIPLIRRALEQDPTNGAYLDSLGWAYYQQDNFSQAQKYLESAVARSDDDPTILGHLGDLYNKMGQTQRAAQIWERAQAAWGHVLPPDYEPGQVAQLDQKLSAVKKRLAQKTPDAPPQR